MVRDYELKRGHWKNVEGDNLVHLIQDVFQEDPEPEGDGWVVKDYGALKKLYVEYVDKTTLRVDTEMNPNVPTEEAQKTLRTWNDFLELATGYDAKQRGKRAQQAAKKAEG